MKNIDPITIAIADDNYIFREGLCRTIQQFGEFALVISEEESEELFRKIMLLPEPPDICIIDMTMPGGYEGLKKIKEEYPSVKVLILSMLDNELSIIRTIKIGANGFLMKGCTPEAFRDALLAVYHDGYHFPGTNNLKKMVPRETLLVQLSYTELEMLSLFCTEMNMSQIAERMNMSLKAAERCREDLMKKTNVHTRIGLVLFALDIGVPPSC